MANSLCRLLMKVNHVIVANIYVSNMSFNAIRENKILANISEFTEFTDWQCQHLGFTSIQSVNKSMYIRTLKIFFVFHGDFTKWYGCRQIRRSGKKLCRNTIFVLIKYISLRNDHSCTLEKKWWPTSTRTSKGRIIPALIARQFSLILVS